MFGVFRVKNHDFTPKNHIFSNFRGGACRVRPPPLDPLLVGIGVVSVMQHSLIMLITASAFTLADFGACVW